MMHRLTFLLGLILPLVFAATAAAVQPTTTTQQFHRSSPHFLSCPGFDVVAEFDITRVSTTFYDSDGNAIRIARHLGYVGTLSNSLTGKSLADDGNVLITIDLVAGTTTFDGKGRVDTIPGLGVVFHVSGRMMFDAAGDLIFEAGPHDDLDNNLGDLCNYLAGA
jgi:hypothetical protein